MGQVDHVETGVYRVRYTVTKTGLYELLATFSEDFGSKVNTFYRGELTVMPGDVWPSKCVAVGYGLNKGAATAKETFYVKVKDRFKNPTNLPDSMDLQLKIAWTCPSNQDSAHNIVNDVSRTTSPSSDRSFMWTYEQVGEEGTYRVSYTIDFPGQYKMQITINETPIADSPFSITIYQARERAKTERYLESIRQFAGSSGVMWDPDTENSWRRDVIMAGYTLPGPIAFRSEWDDVTPLFLKTPSLQDAHARSHERDDTEDVDDEHGRRASPTRVASSIRRGSSTGRSVHRLSFTEREIERVNSAARFTHRKRSTLLHMQLQSIVDDIQKIKTTESETIEAS